MAKIMIGAIFVGNIETVWQGEVNPTKKRRVIIKEYDDSPVELVQGNEFGRFNMGSTVILLFQKDKLFWSSDITENNIVQVGQVLGESKFN